IEVRDSSFSSPEAKLTAENALYLLDNPARVTQEVATVESTVAAPKSGLWWHGLGAMGRYDYFDKMHKADPLNPKWSNEARLEFERLTFPEVYAKQVKDREDAATLSAARDADRDARREHLYVQHPSWRVS